MYQYDDPMRHLTSLKTTNFMTKKLGLDSLFDEVEKTQLNRRNIISILK